MKKMFARGLYLVVDPSMDLDLLVSQLKQVAGSGIVAIQIWDNFQSEADLIKICSAISKVCQQANIPLIINNHWEEAILLGADGVHFDIVPHNWPKIKNKCLKKMLVGLTVNNDLKVASWAVKEEIDYVSFCSMFPSETANSCDLVALDSVKELTETAAIPVLLAGGIRPQNIHQLQQLDYYGLAVVSGVMRAEHPVEAVELYLEKIKK